MRTRSTKSQSREHNSRGATITSNLFLIIGTSIMLTALIYMLVNLDKADAIMARWITCVATGALLSFYGLIFRLSKKVKRKTP
jgi:hypothetical protein